MDGYISQYTRDLIAILGLILTIIGTLISALTLFCKDRKPNHTKDHSGNNVKDVPLTRVVLKFLISPAKEDIESSNGVRFCLLITIYTLLLAIFISWQLVHKPNNEDINRLLYANTFATFFEFSSLTLAIAGITDWLEKKAIISQRKLRQWKVFWFCCWLIAILASTFVMLTIKVGPATNLLRGFLLLQALGIVMSHVIIIGIIVVRLIDD